MKLQLNLDAVPNKVPVVAIGEYDGTIEKIEQQDAKGDRKAQVSFQIKVSTDGSPEKGKSLFDGFPNEFLIDPNSRTSVKLKHLIRSTGMTFNGSEIDMDELLNKSVRFTVTHNNYTANDGTAQTAANIKDYLFSK